MKQSAQLLPCFSGLPLHLIIDTNSGQCPSRAAYTIGDALPGRCVLTKLMFPSATSSASATQTSHHSALLHTPPNHPTNAHWHAQATHDAQIKCKTEAATEQVIVKFHVPFGCNCMHLRQDMLDACPQQSVLPTPALQQECLGLLATGSCSSLLQDPGGASKITFTDCRNDLLAGIPARSNVLEEEGQWDLPLPLAIHKVFRPS